jgi:hypothetical protein
MYTLIGGDGKPYGPVSLQQIRAWIAEGRANAQTKVRLEGTQEWTELGELPELRSPETPPPLPGSHVTDPAVIAAAYIARGKAVDVVECYRRSWNLLWSRFLPLAAASLLGVVFPILVLPVVPIRLGYALFFSGVINGGIQYYIVRMIRGESARPADLLAGFRHAGPLILATFVVSVLTLLGLFFLVLPGIYLAVAYVYTYVLAVDKKLGFWTAMEVSRRVVTSQWWRIFGVFLAGLACLFIGTAAFVVGLIVAIPLVMGTILYAYEDLFTPAPVTSS